MCHLSHPLIINLHYSFQDYDNLYFVLDLLTGGDLRYQLGRHPRRFYNETQTKFFIACIVESLIYIHSKNIIHRDIKPENLVFDEKGYLHVTDFGIAKFSDNRNLNETSGTPGYMAPEVMRGLKHTGSVDYFAVGVITYELMLGKRPYIGKNRREIKEQMMIKQVYLDDDSIPLGWSQEAADFINRLLLKQDTNRLGYYNDFEIKRHPWFNDINFDDLIEGKIRAPFIPRKNHDNYDKKYCEEIEEIGIETNMRYDNYKNNERYYDIFEGFTYYNIDESQLASNHEIYRKPSVKYVKNNSYYNSSENYIINKSKTINIDNDCKRRANHNISHNRAPSANNTSIRTIHYSNGNEITTNRVSNIRQNQRSFFEQNSKNTFKNPHNFYIMASPNRRGRITINNDESNVDNTFRKYANHSFVETNYSNGKTIRRSYSSSNLYNNNYVNVFNLLVNNVNNINNNNILLNNSNNTNNKNNKIYIQSQKPNIPINYNNTNRYKIPIDKKNISNDYNNINYKISKYNNRTNNENTKNTSFSYIENDKNSYIGIQNKDYDNNSFRYSNNLSYKKNSMNNIFKMETIERDKKNYLIPDKYKNLRRNHSYSYVCYFKQDIPHNSIKKIEPINNIGNTISCKKEAIPINYYSNDKHRASYNKIKSIEYVNNNNISNSSIYIDKSQVNKDMNQKKVNINIFNNSKYIQPNENNINGKQNYNINVLNNSNKRAPPPIIQNNNYKNLEIAINNTIFKSRKENTIINVPKNPKEIEKNNTYKKIPIPLPLNPKIKRKKLILEKGNNGKKYEIINKSNQTINYIESKFNYNKYISKQSEENISNNKIINNCSKTIDSYQNSYKILLDNKENNFNNKEDILIKQNKNIIPSKINERNFNEYQYLKNFDKYKKIKNNKAFDKTKLNNYNKKAIHQNMIKKKIIDKYHTIESRDNKIKYKKCTKIEI